VTHGERMARAALAQWIKLWERQQHCSYCKIQQAQCHKHKGLEDFNRLAEQTRRFLAAGPN
jgi:hypothetical protein